MNDRLCTYNIPNFIVGFVDMMASNLVDMIKTWVMSMKVDPERTAIQ